MAFQIHALEAQDFAALFSLSDQELEARGARRSQALHKPGYPCRVSLADAEVGETVILLHYEHQGANTPYRASHAIYVREKAETARLPINQVPLVMTSRLLSIRLFSQDDMMVGADVIEGSELATALDRALAQDSVAYVHIHYAKPGCFAAKATRA